MKVSNGMDMSDFPSESCSSLTLSTTSASVVSSDLTAPCHCYNMKVPPIATFSPLGITYVLEATDDMNIKEIEIQSFQLELLLSRSRGQKHTTRWEDIIAPQQLSNLTISIWTKDSDLNDSSSAMKWRKWKCIHSVQPWKDSHRSEQPSPASLNQPHEHGGHTPEWKEKGIGFASQHKIELADSSITLGSGEIRPLHIQVALETGKPTLLLPRGARVAQLSSSISNTYFHTLSDTLARGPQLRLVALDDPSMATNQSNRRRPRHGHDSNPLDLRGALEEQQEESETNPTAISMPCHDIHLMGNLEYQIKPWVWDRGLQSTDFGPHFRAVARALLAPSVRTPSLIRRLPASLLQNLVHPKQCWQRRRQQRLPSAAQQAWNRLPEVCIEHILDFCGWDWFGDSNVDTWLLRKLPAMPPRWQLIHFIQQS